MEQSSNTFNVAWGNFTLNLEDVARLTMLPLFRGGFGIILQREDQTKPKYFTAAIDASKTSDNPTYATWLRFLMRGVGNMSGYVIDAFLSYETS